MKQMCDLNKHNQILRHLSEIPGRMISIHGRENVAAFVLSDLCHENGFNLTRAAFFVDNPDFDCFKGIAGVHKGDSHGISNVWQDADQYSSYMISSPFNKLIRSIEQKSMARNGHDEKEAVHKIAHELNFVQPKHYSWRMKHDNKGIFVFDHVHGELEELAEHMQNCIHLFSFCPIG
ncbi:MAG: hypothetical protein BWY54_00534 [Candidatus Dependentiae bacterium ADurb.Bin331]|nr:MAG: hypothetical protein BWY54_00534 [Candidatus Dependentiae bacterium ADurb.Bin331]